MVAIAALFGADQYDEQAMIGAALLGEALMRYLQPPKG